MRIFDDDDDDDVRILMQHIARINAIEIILSMWCMCVVVK